MLRNSAEQQDGGVELSSFQRLAILLATLEEPHCKLRVYCDAEQPNKDRVAQSLGDLKVLLGEVFSEIIVIDNLDKFREMIQSSLDQTSISQRKALIFDLTEDPDAKKTKALNMLRDMMYRDDQTLYQVILFDPHFSIGGINGKDLFTFLTMSSETDSDLRNYVALLDKGLRL